MLVRAEKAIRTRWKLPLPTRSIYYTVWSLITFTLSVEFAVWRKNRYPALAIFYEQTKKETKWYTANVHMYTIQSAGSHASRVSSRVGELQRHKKGHGNIYKEYRAAFFHGV